jgi:hypothetical protein
MSKITTLPLEILQQIFRELQSLTSGPRYLFLTSPEGDDVDITDHPEVLETQHPGSDFHTQWRLIDPGSIFLA